MTTTGGATNKTLPKCLTLCFECFYWLVSVIRGLELVFACHQVGELATIEYCLSVGLSFEVALRTRQRLRGKEPEFTNAVPLGRFMLGWDSKKRSLKLVEFDWESAICLRHASRTHP